MPEFCGQPEAGMNWAGAPLVTAGGARPIRRQKPPAIWSLLADASLHLQIASAATKAAVSSLLEHDIVWDASNQHEFLQTINASTDQVDQLIQLLTLAFQLQAGRIELKCEPNVLSEIVAAVERQQRPYWGHLPIDLQLPLDGAPVVADDEFLTLAIELLLRVFVGHLERSPLRVRLVEAPASWRMVLTGLEAATATLVCAQLTNPIDEPVPATALAIESQLRLVVACELLRLHGAQAWISADGSGELNLRLPAAIGPASARG